MTEPKKPSGQTTKDNLKDLSIDSPRLTPPSRADDSPSGEDSTNPMGKGAKQGHSDKAEG